MPKVKKNTQKIQDEKLYNLHNQERIYVPSFLMRTPVYVAVPKQNTEYQYWKHTEV